MTNATQVGSEGAVADRATNLLAETGPEFDSLIALTPDDQASHIDPNPRLDQRMAMGEEDLPKVYRAMWSMVLSVSQEYAPLHEGLDTSRVARVSAMLAADSLVSFFEDNEYDRPGKAFVLTPKISGHIRRHLEMKLTARATVRELAEFLPTSSPAIETTEETGEIVQPTPLPELQRTPEEMVNPKRADYLIKIFGEEHRQTISGLTRKQAVALADKVGDLYRGISAARGTNNKGRFIRASQIVHYVAGANMVTVARMYGQVHGSASSGLYQTVPKGITKHYGEYDLSAVVAAVAEDDQDHTEAIFAKYTDDMMPGKSGKLRKEIAEIAEQQTLPIDGVETPPQPEPPEPEWHKSPLHAEAAVDSTDQDIKDVVERVMPQLRFARETEKRALRTLMHPSVETWREPRELGGVKTDLVRMVGSNTNDHSLPMDCKLSRLETDLLLEIIKSPVDPDKQMTVIRTLRAYTGQGTPPPRQVLVSALLKLGAARELQLK